MKSLYQILAEECNYWQDVLENTENRLLKRTANSNILKRRTQIRKLQRNIPV